MLKTTIVYLLISALCITIERVYAIFGHGVTSSSMSYMFLYPLVGGSAVFLVLWLAKITTNDVKHFRMHYNIYNSGIAAITLGNLLKGVFEIAGTTSAYTKYFYILGVVFTLIAVTGYYSGFQHYKASENLFE